MRKGFTVPFSARENDKEVVWFVQQYGISSVLDIGAGSGTYSDLLKPYVEVIDAVEVWEPYIQQFRLEDKYGIIHRQDVRDLHIDHWDGYDLVIFGDVLEHMSKEDSLNLWGGLEICAVDYGLISIPIVHYPQGAEFGNPYEVHVQEHVTPEELRRDYGPFICEWEYNTTGTFIKEFNQE
jgi:hypothetical protein